MSIFEQEPKVSMYSWHYKLLDLLYDDYDKPKTQCSYFWAVLFLVISLPVWFFGALFESKFNSRPSFLKAIGYSIVFYAALWIALGLISGVLLLPLLYLFPDFVNSVMMIDPSLGHSADGENYTNIGNMVVAFMALDGILLLGCILYGIVEGVKWIGIKIGNGIRTLLENVSEKLDKMSEKPEKEQENTLTFTGSFFGWLSDKKQKVCRPIKYVDENNS